MPYCGVSHVLCTICVRMSSAADSERVSRRYEIFVNQSGHTVEGTGR